MTVRELIAALQKCPPELEVVLWGGEDADDWVPVEDALYEDGASHIAILPYASGALPVHAFGSCGGTCDLCGDEP
jgi:hypothetical protein